jgi:hypothetical protein
MTPVGPDLFKESSGSPFIDLEMGGWEKKKGLGGWEKKKGLEDTKNLTSCDRSCVEPALLVFQNFLY